MVIVIPIVIPVLVVTAGPALGHNGPSRVRCATAGHEHRTMHGTCSSNTRAQPSVDATGISPGHCFRHTCGTRPRICAPPVRCVAGTLPYRPPANAALRQTTEAHSESRQRPAFSRAWCNLAVCSRIASLSNVCENLLGPEFHSGDFAKRQHCTPVPLLLVAQHDRKRRQAEQSNRPRFNAFMK